MGFSDVLDGLGGRLEVVDVEPIGSAAGEITVELSSRFVVRIGSEDVGKGRLQFGSNAQGGQVVLPKKTNLYLFGGRNVDDHSVRVW